MILFCRLIDSQKGSHLQAFEKAMMDEFEKAETIEERTAVMKKYKLGQYADNADEEFEGVYFID